MGFDKGKLSVRKGRKTMGPFEKGSPGSRKTVGICISIPHSVFGMGFLLREQTPGGL